MCTHLRVHLFCRQAVAISLSSQEDAATVHRPLFMTQLTFNLQPTRKAWTVSELTAKIRDLLAKNFTDISVLGEVSNCREAQSGHIYFTLKDDRSQVRCVCFKQQQRGIKFRPEDGLQVTIRGSISVYEQRG